MYCVACVIVAGVRVKYYNGLHCYSIVYHTIMLYSKCQRLLSRTYARVDDRIVGCMCLGRAEYPFL